VNETTELDRAKQIRRTMACIRRELDEDVGEVEQSARTLLNWRYYTQNYPWACVAAATAIGYLVVPRKLEIHSPDPKTLEKLARRRHLVVEQNPKAEAKGGAVGAAFSFISGLVLKTAMAQIGVQLASMMQPQKESPMPADTSPSPDNSSATNRPPLRRPY
jgi:hypothetical protein